MYFFQPNTLKGAQEEIANFVSEEKHIGFHWRKAQGKLNKVVRKNVLETVYEKLPCTTSLYLCAYTEDRHIFLQLISLKHQT